MLMVYNNILIESGRLLIMDYLDAISVSSFILGGIALIEGLFLNFFLSPIDPSASNLQAEFTFGLWIFFWVIAIGVRSLSRNARLDKK